MRFSNSWITVLLGGLLGGSLAVVMGGCPYTNTNHCAYSNIACDAGLICDMCAAESNGCVNLADLTNESCLYGGSATTSSSESMTTTVSMTTMSTTTMTTMTTVEPTTEPVTVSDTSTTATETSMTEPTTTTTTTTTGIMCDPEEPASAECFQADPSKPFCVEMDVCGSCSDLVGITCEDIDASNPACHPDLGTCVKCTADDLGICGDGEVCNQYKNDCGGCTEHEQCPESACDIESGKCFPENSVVWVEQRQDCFIEDGSEQNPYCLLQGAIEEVGKDLVIMLKNGTELQNEQVRVLNGIKVAIIGADDPRPKISEPSSSDPLIVVNKNSYLYISNVDLVDSPKAAPSFLVCEDSTLQLDQVTISGNGKSLNTTGCDVEIKRSVLTANTGSNLISGSSFKMVNSFVSSNKSDEGPFRIDAEVEINHSTIVDNSGTPTTGFACLMMVKSFKVRNSVFLGQPDAIVDCKLTDEGGTHIGTPEDLNMLFQVPPQQKGVFRPRLDAVAIDELAEWADGDPYVDFDGKPRPNVAGATDFAGAARPE